MKMYLSRLYLNSLNKSSENLGCTVSLLNRGIYLQIDLELYMI